MAVTRFPAPAGSYLREESVRIHERPTDPGRTIELGMAQPTSTDDGWWLAVLWASDGGEVLIASDVAPRGGPPPGPPLLTLGPVFAGALSGLIAQEEGRQQLRLRLPEATDDSNAWSRPLLLQVALRWEPLRAATMTQNALAREVLRAFRRAIEAAGRPS